MPAISTSFSATAKPFLVESDSRIFHLLQKFNFLESLHLKATHIKDSALLTELQTSFNLIYQEYNLCFQTGSSNSSVPDLTSSLSPLTVPSSTSIQPPHLSTRKLKKRARAQAWKKIQVEKSSITSVISLPIVPDNPQRNCSCSSSILPIKSRRPPGSTTPAQHHVSTTFVESIHIPFIPVHKREGEYIGDITVKGIRHGRGNMVYTCPDSNGNTYSGSWKFDKFNGFGKHTWAHGTIYEGKWQNGLMHGKGVKTFPDGTVYSGELKNDLYHGRGTYTFSDGSVYSGQFQNDYFNGVGTLTSTDGSVYSGEFKDDLFHGLGKLIEKDGSVLEGFFEKSKFLKAI